MEWHDIFPKKLACKIASSL